MKRTIRLYGLAFLFMFLTVTLFITRPNDASANVGVESKEAKQVISIYEPCHSGAYMFQDAAYHRIE